MDLGLDDDRRGLRDTARSILAAECPPSVVRDAYSDPERWRGLWKTLVELGWPAVGTADDTGDLFDLVLLHEAAGAAILPAPLLSTALAVAALRATGDAATDLLTELAAGSVGALLAQPAHSNLPGPCATLTGSTLTGEVGPSRDATRADLLVVLAADGSGTEQLTVVRPGAGVNLVAADAVDPSTPLAAVHLDTSPELVVPVPSRAALAVPLLLAAAELVGVTQRALDMAVEHAKTRRQFGQPIGAFQAVKHRLADTYVGLERARGLTLLAADRCRRAGSDDPESWQGAMLAKAAAGDAATAATRACVATHGAIGQTWEHDAHLLLRRAWQGSALLGQPDALYAAAAGDHLARTS